MYRDDILSKAVNDCLQEMYLKAQPSLDFNELKERAKNNEEVDKDFWSHHYLPRKEYDDILYSYMHAYGIESKWDDYAQTMIDYLEKGGTKDTWVEGETDSNGFKYSGHRGYEDTPKISDVIGEEAAAKVLELMKTCKEFYKFNRDEMSFNFTVSNYSPSMCKEMVQEYWDNVDKTVKIYDKVIDPETGEWVVVTPEYIKECEEQVECMEQYDNWLYEEYKKLVEKYS